MKVWRFLIKDWVFKLAALIVSVGLYTFVHFEQGSQLTVDLEIRWSGVQEDRMIVADQLPRIRMVLDGPATLLGQVDNSIVYEFPASELSLGSNIVRIDVTKLPLPRGVSVERISPSSVEIDYVETESKQLPIKLNYKGQVAEGFKLGNIRAEPSLVTVTAQKGQLGGMLFIPSTVVDLKERSSSFDLAVDLKLQDINVKKVEPKLITAIVEIVAEVETRVIRDIPILVRGVSLAEVELLPATIEVTLVGSSAVLDKISGNLVAFVNAGEVPVRPTPFSVELELPSGVEARALAPDLVVMRAKKKD